MRQPRGSCFELVGSRQHGVAQQKVEQPTRVEWSTLWLGTQEIAGKMRYDTNTTALPIILAGILNPRSCETLGVPYIRYSLDAGSSVLYHFVLGAEIPRFNFYSYKQYAMRVVIQCRGLRGRGVGSLDEVLYRYVPSKSSNLDPVFKGFCLPKYRKVCSEGGAILLQWIVPPMYFP